MDGKIKQRTLQYFGKVSDEEYEQLRLRSKNGEFDHLSKTKNIAQLSVDLNAKSDCNLPLNIGWKTLDKAYKSLGISSVFAKYSSTKRFKYDLDQVMKLLVFGRILEPKSKSKTIGQFQKTLFGSWEISQNDMDRSLDHFEKVRDDLQFQIHKKICENIGRSATLVFYDVTNYYFEIDGADDFRKRGPSKEHRPKPIVQMGLFMDSNGIPITYKLFEGNQVDPKTYIPAIEQVKKQFGIERIVTVADKAMNSMDNVADALKNGDGWLFSSRFKGKKGAPKDIQTAMIENDGWEYNAKMTFAKKSFIRTRKLKNGENTQEKVVLTWRYKYAIREKMKRLEVLGFADKMTKSEIERQLLGKGVKKYLLIEDENGEKISLAKYCKVNYEQVEFDEQFDGMNALVTSEIDMSDEEIIAAYGQLNRIEDCFRITKTDLKTRPIYVWTRAHIESHFLTCFVALVILKLLHYKLERKYSVNRIIEALGSMKIGVMGNDIGILYKNDDATKMQEFLGVDISRTHYRMETITKM